MDRQGPRGLGRVDAPQTVVDARDHAQGRVAVPGALERGLHARRVLGRGHDEIVLAEQRQHGALGSLQGGERVVPRVEPQPVVVLGIARRGAAELREPAARLDGAPSLFVARPFLVGLRAAPDALDVGGGLAGLGLTMTGGAEQAEPAARELLPRRHGRGDEQHEERHARAAARGQRRGPAAAAGTGDAECSASMSARRASTSSAAQASSAL